MEGIGSEVSHKIRAAIKAKLIELGAYIDDELPDYIMVMVANKRSKRQMDEDLQLFLGSNTKTFTSWLHTVLQKLQEVTVASFDVKKEMSGGKVGKRRGSYSNEEVKDNKLSDEKGKTSKKHAKKHKDSKKMKKSKHKVKDKEKSKSSEKRQRSDKEDGEKSDKLERDDVSSCHIVNSNDQNKNVSNSLKLDNSSSTGLCGSSENVDKFKSCRVDHSRSSSKSSSASHFTHEVIKTKTGSENYRKLGEDKSLDQDKYTCETAVVIEDEFNIEPLQPNEVWDSGANDELEDKINSSMTVKAPTRELLKEHDKIHSGTEEIAAKDKKKSNKDSEESLSPEEIRKQLLLSQAKRKIEQSKIPGRMKSNSPEADIVDNNSISDREDKFSNRAPSRKTHSRECESERERTVYKTEGYKSANKKSPGKYKSDESTGNRKNENKKNVISISKSLEMEKNLGVKSDEAKTRTKLVTSPRRKPVSSRVVSIPEPDSPEIPSIVKVKPREYVPKDKQANKVLILKAVADAEKSIATVHNRNESEVEVKKTEGIFTKNLREKRYEKLAVTLSNVQTGVAERDRAKRMVSLDSENTNAVDRKTDSLQDSELSQGFKSMPDLTLRNISSKSEDQFISSKTSAVEKNDKYIHCWLEGVEKAVKDEEIVNPSEIDDFHRNFSEEGKECDGKPVKEEDKKRKRPRADEACKQTGEKSSSNSDDGPQIVVTLDGLTSKAIKDIILRNRDAPNGPLLTTSRKGKEGDGSDVEVLKSRYKSADSSMNAGTSRNSDGESRGKGFEKISERFGRLNKTSELHEYKEKYYEFERERYEKKYLEYQGTDKEKHYEKLKDKYANAGESKNKKLIAKLSEKFGKVDREFENKKRKYSDEDARYSYGTSRRVDRNAERDGKYKKMDRNSIRSDKDESRGVRSKERCMFWPRCFKGKHCVYQHTS